MREAICIRSRALRGEGESQKSHPFKQHMCVPALALHPREHRAGPARSVQQLLMNTRQCHQSRQLLQRGPRQLQQRPACGAVLLPRLCDTLRQTLLHLWTQQLQRPHTTARRLWQRVQTKGAQLVQCQKDKIGSVMHTCTLKYKLHAQLAYGTTHRQLG
jgi:hypothetical protein